MGRLTALFNIISSVRQAVYLLFEDEERERERRGISLCLCASVVGDGRSGGYVLNWTVRGRAVMLQVKKDGEG